MIAFFRELLRVVTPDGRRRLQRNMAGAASLAFVEMTALVLMVPLLQIIVTPEAEPTGVGKLVGDLLGDPKPLRIAAYLGGAVVATYVLRLVLALLVLRSAATTVLREEAHAAGQLLHSAITATQDEALIADASATQRTMLNSLNHVYSVAVPWTISAVADLASGLMIALILAITSPMSALAAGVMFGGVFVFHERLIRRRVSWAATAVYDGMPEVYQNISEGLRTSRITRLRGATEFYPRRLVKTKLELLPAVRVQQVLVQTPRYVMEFATMAAAAGVAALAFAVQDPADALSTVGLFLAAGFRIAPMAQRGLYGYQIARSTAPSLADIEAALAAARSRSAAEPNEPLAEPNEAPLVELRDVSFGYPERDADALTGVNLRIRAGEFLAIIGPSGSGKSTLLDVIMGLLDPDRGAVTINGKPIDRCRAAWQGAIGYVPQAVPILNDTFTSNIAFAVDPAEIDDGALMKSVARAELDDVVRALPEGMATVVGDEGSRLSGGQRQRLGIARALYSDPQVLVLDEATSQLDLETEHRLAQLLDDLKGSVTIVAVAHRLTTVLRSDRVIYLEAGEIKADGTFAELERSSPQVARAIDLATIRIGGLDPDVETTGDPTP